VPEDFTEPSFSDRKDSREPTVDGTLRLDNISKSYGSVRALNAINMELRKGQILALFGENGAGKSTLIKIISGITSPDVGSMTLSGAPYKPKSTVMALNSGVGVITQELSLCPDLTVAENIVLGVWPKPYNISRRDLFSKVTNFLESIGIELPLTKQLSELSLAERQLVEIIKIFYRNPKTILLDEPTAALPRREADRVLELLRRVARQGTSVIIVTHRLDEALGVCDSCMVLRNGEITLKVDKGPIPAPTQVIRAMIGRDLTNFDKTSAYEGSGREALRLKGLTCHGNPGLNHVSFDVKFGEIVGIYGEIGSGVDFLASTLSGNQVLESGQLIVLDNSYDKSFKNPQQRVKSGLTFIPGDRANNGLALIQSVITNLLYPPSSNGKENSLVIHKKKEFEQANDLVDSFNIISDSLTQPVASLSGGNQQKVLVASRLRNGIFRNRIIVLHEPSRGVDVGAREAIHNVIRTASREGAATLVISSDVDEVVRLADRVAVFRTGELVKVFSKAELSIEAILLAGETVA